MSQVEDSTSKVSYLPYRDGDLSRGSQEKSADSDSSSYYSSSSEDEADANDKPMKAFVSSTRSTGSKRSTLRLGRSKVKILEVTFMAIAIAIVVALFSLPVVSYVYASSRHQEMNITVDNVSVNTVLNVTCEGLSWGVASSEVCSSEPYTNGGTCGAQLLSWQECVLGISDVPVTVSISGSSQSELEQNAAIFFSLLDAFVQSTTAECEAVAASFVCLYLFPLCDESGRVYLPSQEMCLEVSMDICSQEWSAAQLLDQDNQLPNCADLPTESSNNSMNDVPVPASTANVTNITCSPMFTVIDGICIPNCYTFFAGPKDRIQANSIAVYMAGSFGMLMSVILFLASFWRRKIMWKFPYVFLIYVAIEYSILVFFVLVSLADRGLYCNSVNMIESTNNPTVFCTIGGAVGHYFLISMAYFWFFHVCSTFYKVMFPHMAKRTEGKQGFIHAGLVFLALFLPLPPVILVLADTNFEYVVPSYPPYLCLSKSINYVVFYSMVLVLNVLLAVGVTLFIPIFWAIHKHRKTILSSKRKRKWRISIVEHKLLFTLGYFVVFGIVSLVFFYEVLAEQDNINDILQDYFLCEAPGQNVISNCSFYLDQLTGYSNLATATYTLLGIFPLIILIFTINWKTVLKKVKALLMKCSCMHSGSDVGPVAFSTYSPAPPTVNEE